MRTELLNLLELEADIFAAQQISNRLTRHGSTWEGVDYDKSRDKQIIEHMKKLKGFYTDIFIIDSLKWQAFRKEIKKYSVSQESLITLLQTTGQETSAAWVSDASEEVKAFIHFLSGKKIRSTPDELHTFIQSRSFSKLIDRFLTTHIGKDAQRKFIYNLDHGGIKSKGFDGIGKTCPVAKAPNIAYTYFLFAGAEFLLMRTISIKYGIWESE